MGVKYRTCVSMFLSAVVAVACAQQSASTRPAQPILNPTTVPTQVIEAVVAQNPTPTASQTPSATSAATASAVPIPRAITPNNAGDLALVAQWTTFAPAAFAWSPDGKYLATALNSPDSPDRLKMFELPSLEVLWSLALWAGDIEFMNHSDRIVVSDFDNDSVTLIESSSGVILEYLSDDDCGYFQWPDLSLSGDDSKLIVAGSTGGLNAEHVVTYQWYLNTGVCRGLFIRHRGELHTVDISPNGESLIIGVFQAGPPYVAQVHLWEIATKQLHCWFRSMSAAFSPQGDIIAVVNHQNETLQFYDPADCQLLLVSDVSFPVQTRSYKLGFSPDGRLLAVGDESLRVMDTETGELLWEVEIDDHLEKVAFSPDGLYLAASTCYPCAVNLWSAVDDR